MGYTGSTRGPFCVHVFDVLAQPVTLVRTSEGFQPNPRTPFRPTVFDSLRVAAEALRAHPYLFAGFTREAYGWSAAGPAMCAKAHLADQPCPEAWTPALRQTRIGGGR